MATVAPCSARVRAVTAPRFMEAPVTSAVLPSSGFGSVALMGHGLLRQPTGHPVAASEIVVGDRDAALLGHQGAAVLQDAAGPELAQAGRFPLPPDAVPAHIG